jgi:monofunctional glycosyltransferase
MRNYDKKSAVRTHEYVTPVVIYLERPIHHKRSIRWFLLCVGVIFFSGAILAACSVLQISMLKTHNPQITSLMEFRIEQKQRASDEYKIDQRYVPLSDISANLINAVLISEDDKFYEHQGFDWEQIMEAWIKNQTNNKIVRGGSTISQQLVKNLFLNPSRSFRRKTGEAILTFLAERLLDKRRILELYLNVVEWGDGIFGVEAATQKYFHKSAKRLTILESIRLASTLPNPIRYSPQSQWSQRMKEKRIFIAERMKERGMIDEALCQSLIENF